MSDILTMPGLRKSRSADVGDKLIAAAGALVPRLRELAPQADTDRRVPDETFAAFHEAGLFRAFKPKRFGGLQLGLYEHAMIAMELARGCPSSGWIFSLLNEHSWFISLFPKDAQEEMWGTNSQSCAAGSIRPNAQRSKVEHVGGGYRISGQFPFASGSDHADWIILAAFVPPTKDGQNAESHFFLVPKRELTMIDDWFVLGMRGTGSRTYAAENVVVPSHRAVRAADIFAGQTEGSSLYPDWRLLRAPRTKAMPFGTAAPTVGIALGALDAFQESAKDTSRRGKSIADSNSVQLKFSESAAEAYSAKLLVKAGVEDLMTQIDAGLPVTDELASRTIRDSAFAGLLSHRAVDRLHAAVGSSAVFGGHPIERALRDVHTAMAQVGVQWEVGGLPYAEYLLKNAPVLTAGSRQ